MENPSFINKLIGRRMFMAASATAGVLASLPSAVKAFFVDYFPVRTVERDTFEFDPASGLINWKGTGKSEQYRLRVDGLVDKELSLTYSDILALKRVSQVSDLHCVEGWSVADIVWEGFRINEIVNMAMPKQDAKYVIFHSLGNTGRGPYEYYLECHPIDYLLDEGQKCLMAHTMNGSPLPHDHGSPLRLVAPMSLGYKNIKYVMQMEFSAKPRDGWWTAANPIYKFNAPVPQERLNRK